MIYKYKTEIPGLKYRPSFYPFNAQNVTLDSFDSFKGYNDYIESIDASQENMYHGPIDFTEANQAILKAVLFQYRVSNVATDEKLTVLEIGVAREKPSSTDIFLNKCNRYYGVDLRDVSELVKSNETCEAKTLIANSYEQQKVREFVGPEPIDILFIDGDHSIETVLNDWKYHDMVKEGGLIVMHDTNHHPGPREVFDAVDEAYFAKRRYCLSDYGIAVIQKLI